MDGRISNLEFVDDRTLAAIYRRAACGLLPSEREGFGLPLRFEAMALEHHTCWNVAPRVAGALARPPRSRSGAGPSFYWAQFASRVAQVYRKWRRRPPTHADPDLGLTPTVYDEVLSITRCRAGSVVRVERVGAMGSLASVPLRWEWNSLPDDEQARRKGEIEETRRVSPDRWMSYCAQEHRAGEQRKRRPD